MKQFILFSLFFFFILSVNFAQLTIKDQSATPVTLLEVNDEGIGGSITFPQLSTISSSTSKLYNLGGNLYWGSNQLGLAGNTDGWTDAGTNIYTTTLTDKIGIGTTTPSANLHVNGDDGVLFEGTFGGTGIIPKEGAGARMMWYPPKAAFRVGFVNGGNWDDTNIGNYSIATGDGTTASGQRSTAMGYYTDASGTSSTAMGIATTASGLSSIAMGNGTTASGSSSTAMGVRTIAESYVSTTIGRYNIGGGNSLEWIETDPLFEIGNGTNSSEKNNVFTVLKNGKVGIGNASPTHEMQIHETTSNYSYIHITNETTSSADGSGVVFGLDADEDVRIHSFEDNNIKFITNNSERLRIDNTGNIGIGTNSPKSKLSIVGLLEYADNAAAKSAGLVNGDLYRTGDLLKIVH